MSDELDKLAVALGRALAEDLPVKHLVSQLIDVVGKVNPRDHDAVRPVAARLESLMRLACQEETPNSWEAQGALSVLLSQAKKSLNAHLVTESQAQDK